MDEPAHAGRERLVGDQLRPADVDREDELAVAVVERALGGDVKDELDAIDSAADRSTLGDFAGHIL
jgi:hypothetical protein